WRGALTALRQLRAAGLAGDPRVHTGVIGALASARRWREALDVLRQMREVDGLSPNVVSFTAAMRALATSGKVTEALALLQEMEEGGIAPNERTYAAALGACAAAGDADSAVNLLHLMRRAGVIPTTRSLNDVVSNLTRRRRYREVIAVVEAAAGTSAILPSNVVLDAWTAVAAIDACSRCGQWRKGLALLAAAATAGKAGERTYNAALKGLAAAGQWQRARRLLANMAAAGVPATGISYSTVIHACARGAEVALAAAVVSSAAAALLAGELTSDVPAAAAAAAEAAEAAAASLELLVEMRATGVAPYLNAYNAAIDANGRAGRVDVALKLLEEIRIVGLEPDVVSNTVTAATW
ncbi:unnamed protein product, partial [Phaeothamnion confervicola]